MNQTNLSAFIWSVADLLRGDYKPLEYGKVILPFTVLRRLDCVLAPTKAKVLAELGAKTSRSKKTRLIPSEAGPWPIRCCGCMGRPDNRASWAETLVPASTG